jgi:hypothetical protein
VDRVRPSSDDVHDIVFFQRHEDDDPNRSIPGRDFLNSCPTGIRGKFRACLVAIAAAPPKRFAGGGLWEAMHGTMAGWFEVRVDGPRRHHYRLYCLLDYEAAGVSRPLLTVITGLDKRFRTTFGEREYAKVRELGVEYLSRNPRSVA